MKVLVTGAAGFIGFHVVQRLLREGYQVVGLDSINDYYSPQLKRDRLRELGVQVDNDGALSADGFSFYKSKLEDLEALEQIFNTHKIDRIIHLAAQAGVRYSLENPRVYISSNLVGFFNILECCRKFEVAHLVYASSSSVYGNSSAVPFQEDQVEYKPVSLYAATKQSNEHLAYAYSHIYGFRTTGLRFFTVFGPWGRPDMAYFLFAEKILAGKPIQIFNYGNQYRDFTYINDVIDVIPGILQKADWSDDGGVPADVYNIGNNAPVQLMDFIAEIESALGKEAEKEMMPPINVDVERTYANIDRAAEAFGFSPSYDFGKGIRNFVQWLVEYKEYVAAIVPPKS